MTESDIQNDDGSATALLSKEPFLTVFKYIGISHWYFSLVSHPEGEVSDICMGVSETRHGWAFFEEKVGFLPFILKSSLVDGQSRLPACFINRNKMHLQMMKQLLWLA